MARSMHIYTIKNVAVMIGKNPELLRMQHRLRRNGVRPR
jgi:hypothetical protein